MNGVKDIRNTSQNNKKKLKTKKLLHQRVNFALFILFLKKDQIPSFRVVCFFFFIDISGYFFSCAIIHTVIKNIGSHSMCAVSSILTLSFLSYDCFFFVLSLSLCSQFHICDCAIVRMYGCVCVCERAREQAVIARKKKKIFIAIKAVCCFIFLFPNIIIIIRVKMKTEWTEWTKKTK